MDPDPHAHPHHVRRHRRRGARRLLVGGHRSGPRRRRERRVRLDRSGRRRLVLRPGPRGEVGQEPAAPRPHQRRPGRRRGPPDAPRCRAAARLPAHRPRPTASSTSWSVDRRPSASRRSESSRVHRDRPGDSASSGPIGRRGRPGACSTPCCSIRPPTASATTSSTWRTTPCRTATSPSPSSGRRSTTRTASILTGQGRLVPRLPARAGHRPGRRRRAVRRPALLAGRPGRPDRLAGRRGVVGRVRHARPGSRATG